MLTASEALQQAWKAAGGQPGALDSVILSGAEPTLPSSFAVGTMCQAAVAGAGLAAAELWHRRGGEGQMVTVDMRHAAVECRSERYLQIDGAPAGGFRDPLAGIYRCADGRWLRPHLTYPHHRQRFLELLGCDPQAVAREELARAILAWPAAELEEAAMRCGAVAAASRSFAEWDEHPQGRAVAALPLLGVERIGDAPPRPLPMAARPLAGVRVLDLTHIIAGPVAGRVMAAHGAEVLKVSGPQRPGVRILDIDTGRGKRACHIELRDPAGREQLRALIADADVLLQSYRPGALAAAGFGPEQVCRFQKTAALNVRSRLHYSSGGVGSIRQRRAAAGHQRTQGGLSATGRSMRHRWPSRRGSESARIDLRCPTSH